MEQRQGRYLGGNVVRFLLSYLGLMFEFYIIDHIKLNETDITFYRCTLHNGKCLFPNKPNYEESE